MMSSNSMTTQQSTEVNGMGAPGATGKTQQGAVSGMIRSLKGEGKATLKRGGYSGAVSLENVKNAQSKSGTKSKIELHTQTGVYNVKNVSVKINKNGVATIKGHENAKLGYKGTTKNGTLILHTKGVSSGSSSRRAYSKSYDAKVKAYMKKGYTQKQARAKVKADNKRAKEEKMTRAAKYGYNDSP